jgi:hypothetical protein
MLRHAFSYAANDKQWLDPKLKDELLRDAPKLVGSVMAKCRAARDAGQPDIARELLECAVQVVRTIKHVDASPPA